VSGLARPALLPLVPLYRAALGVRSLQLQLGWELVRRLRRPVVSVGSLSAGGAGKTPMVIALARGLLSLGLQVDVLSRGYGRRSLAASRVDPEGHAEEFGDEPLLIARQAGVPVYVAAQRYEAGRMAEANSDGAPVVHLLDDGFQHRQLHRDVNLLLLDENDLTDRLLPAGNLREPLSAMLRATVVAIPAGDRAASVESLLGARGWNGPVWRIFRRVQVPVIEGRVVAFCGIARPAQFFAGLESAGMQLAARLSFADHHPYTNRDLEQILSSAQSAGAKAIVTTEKDRVRLGGLALRLKERAALHTANLRVEIQDEDAALDWLQEQIAEAAATPS
jgi:tetraacyldisaccharide 4'-kinase